jgi:hypothetical protein
VIGSRVSLVPPAPRAAFLCIGAAVLLGGVTAAAGAKEMLPFAVLPLAIGLLLLFGGDRRFLARFTPAAVEIARPKQSIPYSSIHEVRPIVPLGAARPRSFPIEIVHQGGSITFPATLTAPSERVYAFLRGHLADRTPRDLPEAMSTYQREQEQSFGADRVFCYGGRRGPFRHDAPRWRAAGYGLLITAALWATLAFFRPGAEGWYVGAGLAAFIGALCLVAAWRGSGGGADPTRTSGAALVISPLGLAMEQGPLNGHLTWQQIRKVSVQVPGKGITVTRTVPGISVEVEGATFVITDSYDRPLPEIHERIVKYWR